MKRSRYLLIICAALGMVACGSSPTANQDGRPVITATILPIKYLVERITGNDFNINILVPPGSSPETFEPTPRQLAETSRSQFIFATGLIDFEHSLTGRIENSVTVTELHQGLDVKLGDCGHRHDSPTHSHHAGGVDPHIWTSPRCLKQMAKNIHSAIISQFPDSLKYTNNYNSLLGSLEQTDSIIRNIIAGSSIRHFIVYHPALSYYANDYGLTQISLENDGKEPSVESLKNTITKAKQLKINKILYQKEFSRATVTAATQDLGIECVEINPLSEDVENNLITITKIITDHDATK